MFFCVSLDWADWHLIIFLICFAALIFSFCRNGVRPFKGDSEIQIGSFLVLINSQIHV